MLTSRCAGSTLLSVTAIYILHHRRCVQDRRHGCTHTRRNGTTSPGPDLSEDVLALNSLNGQPSSGTVPIGCRSRLALQYGRSRFSPLRPMGSWDQVKPSNKMCHSSLTGEPPLIEDPVSHFPTGNESKTNS